MAGENENTCEICTIIYIWITPYRRNKKIADPYQEGRDRDTDPVVIDRMIIMNGISMSLVPDGGYGGINGRGGFHQKVPLKGV